MSGTDGLSDICDLSPVIRIVDIAATLGHLKLFSVAMYAARIIFSCLFNNLSWITLNATCPVYVPLHVHASPWRCNFSGDGHQRNARLFWLKPRPVSPQYALLHLLHVMQYTARLGPYTAKCIGDFYGTTVLPIVLAIFMVIP